MLQRHDPGCPSKGICYMIFACCHWSTDIAGMRNSLSGPAFLLMSFWQVDFTRCLLTAGPGFIRNFGRCDKLKPPTAITQWGLNISLRLVLCEPGNSNAPSHLCNSTHHIRNPLQILVCSLLPSHRSTYNFKHQFSHKLASNYFQLSTGEELVCSESQKKSVL